MELTKEHFDQVLKGLATKDEFKGLGSDVAAIKAGIVNLATQDSLNELANTVAEIKQTVDVHTTALDTLLKAHKTRKDENIISIDRFTRLELWAKQVGEKLGIKLEL